MKTRDEILRLVGDLKFSSRNCFYSVLDQLTLKSPGAGELVKVTWPHALGVLTLEDWNTAYDTAMQMCADMTGYRPPGASIGREEIN